MTAPEKELLDRFHQVLVQEIRERKPEYLSEAFTVAEIYQDLVPYHTHRDRIGVRMNGDYEDALLRLLSGEGDRLTLESDAARRDFLEELKNAAPNTGIYRDFAAVNVRLNSETLPDADATDGEEAAVATDEGEKKSAPESTAKDEAKGADGGDAGDAPRFLPDPVPSEEKPATKATAKSAKSDRGTAGKASKGKGGGACVWCSEALPNRADAVFCPHCGGDGRLQPCPACGTELEAGWTFCIACGERVTS